MNDPSIPIFRYVPHLLDESLVLESFRDGRLAGGARLAELERRVAKICGLSTGVCVSSVTSAVAMLAAGLDLARDDEVIMSPLAPASIAAGLRSRGVRLVFADVCPGTMNLDAARVEAAITPFTKAIVFSHTFGSSAGAPEVAKLAGRQEITLIEDVTEALGSRIADRPVGGFGRAALASMGPFSAIPSGSGGLVLSSDERLGAAVRAIRAGEASPLGMVAPVEAGWPSELCVALSLGQARRIEELREQRLQLAVSYMRRLMSTIGVVAPTVDNDEVAPHWSGILCRLEAGYTEEERDGVVRGMRIHEIEVAAPRRCVYNFALTESDPASCTVARSIAKRLIRLPFHLGMSSQDIEMVAQTLALMISRENLSRGG